MDEEKGLLIMFYVAGVAGLSILINGSTTKVIVQYLRIDRSSAAAGVFYSKVVDQIQKRVESTLDVARRDEHFTGADWTAVSLALPVLSKRMRTAVEQRIGRVLEPPVIA